MRRKKSAPTLKLEFKSLRKQDRELRYLSRLISWPGASAANLWLLRNLRLAGGYIVQSIARGYSHMAVESELQKIQKSDVKNGALKCAARSTSGDKSRWLDL